MKEREKRKGKEANKKNGPKLVGEDWSESLKSDCKRGMITKGGNVKRE